MCCLYLGVTHMVMAQIPKPTIEQVEWADCEIGAIIHFDINVYEPEYQWRRQWDYNPDAKIFNPAALNTDQWVKAVKDMGGEYAVLVVKHCTGFCLWPSEAHEYTIKHSPYKGGKGDILGERLCLLKRRASIWGARILRIWVQNIHLLWLMRRKLRGLAALSRIASVRASPYDS